MTLLDQQMHECDCCGKIVREVHRVWYLGYMETFACNECLGRLDEEETEEKRQNQEKALDRWIGIGSS